MVPYPAKIKPEQNCTGYNPMDTHNSVITCGNVNDSPSPAVTYSAQTQHLQNRPIRDCNMNDTSFIMQLTSAQKGLVQASCGYGGMHLQQQGFPFRLPVPNTHVPAVGVSGFLSFY